MQDIAGFGLSVRIIASKTFPQGFTVTEFADDTDPFDLPELQIADAAMNLNGGMATWSTANVIQWAIGVMPNTEDDKNLQVLFEANRPARGKKPAKDIITVVGMYPDGSTRVLSPGIIYSATPGKSVASAGRLKSKTYNFRFENTAGAEAS